MQVDSELEVAQPEEEEKSVEAQGDRVRKTLESAQVENKNMKEENKSLLKSRGDLKKQREQVTRIEMQSNAEANVILI